MRYMRSGAGRLLGTWDVDFNTQETYGQYDSAGRLSSYKIPAGTYSNFTYDAEGEVTGYTGFNGVAVTNTWNSRRAPVAKLQSESNRERLLCVARLLMGLISRHPRSFVDRGLGREDRRAAQHRHGQVTYDAIGRVTQASNPSASAQFRYDAENRLTSGSAVAIMDTGSCGTAFAPGGTNHNLSYQYGGDGHVAQDVYVDPTWTQHTRQWHWAKDTLGYTATGGSVDFINADDLGVIPPAGAAPGLTMYDRDRDGLITSSHNITGYDAGSRRIRTRSRGFRRARHRRRADSSRLRLVLSSSRQRDKRKTAVIVPNPQRGGPSCRRHQPTWRPKLRSPPRMRHASLRNIPTAGTGPGAMGSGKLVTIAAAVREASRALAKAGRSLTRIMVAVMGASRTRRTSQENRSAPSPTVS